MKAIEILNVARGIVKESLRKRREVLNKILLIIPILSVVKLFLISIITYNLIYVFTGLSLTYLLYITLKRVDNITSEYDTDSICEVAVYYALTKWAIISFLSILAYNPFALIAVLNILLSDRLYTATMLIFLIVFLTYMIFDIKLLFIYPLILFVLSYIDVIFTLQGYKRSYLVQTIRNINILMTLITGTIWGYSIYYLYTYNISGLFHIW
ncbi:hypothetical protein NEOKW01_0748 [Nematocida sp. AWRm80]|nr:hypothetical protein NEOKW01_0748 [Nematocida sp. AWRm80]